MGHHPGFYGHPPRHVLPYPHAAVAAVDPVQAKRDAEAAFRQLLAESGLTPFSMWAREEPRLKKDPRFVAVKSARDRKTIFDAFCQELAERSNQEKEDKRRAALEGPGKLFREVAAALRAGKDIVRVAEGREPGEEEVLEAVSSLTLPDVLSFYAGDARMGSFKEETLQALWEEIVAPALQHAKKASVLGKAKKRQAFLAMLRGREVPAGAAWDEWRDKLSAEETMSDLSMAEAEELFRCVLSRVRLAAPQ